MVMPRSDSAFWNSLLSGNCFCISCRLASISGSGMEMLRVRISWRSAV